MAAACCVAAGIVLGRLGPAGPAFRAAAPCLALAGFAAAFVHSVDTWRRPTAALTFDVALASALTLSAASLYVARHAMVPSDDVSRLAGSGTISVVGRVIEARPGTRRSRAIVRLVANDEGETECAERAAGDLWVSWPPDAPAPVRGQLVRAAGEVRRPSAPRNPGSFDFRAYLADRDVHAVMSAERIAVIERPHGLPALAAWVRRSVRERLPADRADVMCALLLGDSSALPDELIASFRRSGTVHVLAVSGLHVGFIALMAGALLRCTGVTGRRAKLLVIPCLFMFVALVGWRASAVRAAIMASTLLLSWSLERRVPTLNTIGVAALAVLVVRPGSLFDLGFTLSFGATLGIVLLHPVVRKGLEPLAGLGRPGRLVADSIALSVSAQLGVAPVAIWAFGQISLVSPAANLAAVPLAAFSVASGVGMLATSALPCLSRLFAGAAWASLGCLSWTSQAAGSLAHASATVAARFWPVAVLVAVGVRLWAGGKSARLRSGAVLGAACVAALVTWSWGPGQSRPRLIAFDVGQGDAILLELPGRRHVLVDAGPAWRGSGGGDAGRSIIAPYLSKRGARSLDAIVITHGHDDHFGGAASVLEAVETRSLVLPLGYQHSEALRDIALAAQERGTDVVEAAAGDTIGVVPGFPMVVLSPADELLADRASENDSSVMLEAHLAWATAMLTGDAEERAERYVLGSGRPIDADILKVAHHGSSTSSSSQLLAAVSPSVALISVGEGNRYGHPDAAALARLEDAGARIFRTDRDGAIIVDVLGSGLSVGGFLSGRAWKSRKEHL